MPPQVTDGEARAKGRVKTFGSSRNESLKDGLWYWWKWIEILWQRKEAEFASLYDLKGTTKARHRTPRLVLEGNCSCHDCCTGSPMPLTCGCHQDPTLPFECLQVSCEVGTQGFNQLQTNAPQRLWLKKQLLFPLGCLLYLQIMLFTVKHSICCLHMVRLKSQHLRIKLEGKKLLQLQLPVGSSM